MECILAHIAYQAINNNGDKERIRELLKPVLRSCLEKKAQFKNKEGKCRIIQKIPYYDVVKCEYLKENNCTYKKNGK